MSNISAGLVANATTIATTTLINSSSFYNQIATSTSTNYAIALPILPILNQEYTIRNDGVNYALIFPGNSTSLINGLAAGLGYYLAAGGTMKIIAYTSDVGLTNTTQWYTLGNYGADLVYNLTTAQLQAGYTITAAHGKRAIFTIPALSGAGVLTLPAVAACSGCEYICKAIGTLGQSCVITGATAVICGMVLCATTASNSGTAAFGFSTAGAANASVTMTTASVVGDEVIIRSDGVRYHVTGSNQVKGALTVP